MYDRENPKPTPWLDALQETRKKSKPPNCRKCPLYDELMVYPKSELGSLKKCDILVLAPSSTPIVGWVRDKIEQWRSEKYIDMPFADKTEKIIKSAVEALREKNKYNAIVNFWYSIACKSWKPNKSISDCCESYLASYLDQVTPKVIIPLGSEAMKALKMTNNFKDARGQVFEIELFGREYKVVPSFHPVRIKKTPGLLEELYIDVERAFESLKEVKVTPLSEITKEYILPKTVEEVEQVVDTILNYTKNGKATPLSVDIETNTVYPFERNAKSIMISFAWDEGKATTIVLDHKQATPEYRERLPYIQELVQKVLASDRPKIGQNFKFDWKFLVCKEGYAINYFVHDTLLMEHLLCEERSTYGLKSLVRDYFPEYANYEEATEAVKADKQYQKRWFPSLAQTSFPKHLKVTKQNAEKKKQDPFFFLARALYEYSYYFTRALMLPIQYIVSPDKTFEDLPLGDLCYYAAIDADVTWKLAKKQLMALPRENGDKVAERKRLEKNLADAKTKAEQDDYQLELSKVRLLKEINADYIIPLTTLYADIEYRGFSLDTRKAEQWIKDSEEGMQKYEARIYSLAGEEFTIKNPTDLGRILYSKLGLPIVKRTPSGNPSTDSESLKGLHEKTGHEIVEALLTYREAKSCYEKVSGYKDSASIDGAIHTDFKQFGTTTGRLSSGGEEGTGISKDRRTVNLQNVSKKNIFGHRMKELFIPSDPETMNIGNMDLGTAEVMVLTAYAPDPKLITAILKGLDFHCYTASTLYDIPYEEFFANRVKEDETGEKIYHENGKYYNQMRSEAKTVTFGVAYGKKAFTLARDLGISEAEAQEILDKFLVTFPLTKIYQDTTIDEAIRRGYVDTFFGRKRRFEILRHNPRDWHARNQAINFKIQSTTADLLNAQMLELYQPLKDELQGNILAQVHDSIVFEYDKTISNDKLLNFFNYYITERISQKYPWIPVPIKCDVEVGPNYADLRKL